MNKSEPSSMVPYETRRVDELEVRVYPNQNELSISVAAEVNAYLGDVISRQGYARVILATGNSQIQFLERLTKLGGVDWSKTTLFHMDEYLGIDDGHKASFRRYMRERVESTLRPGAFHYIEGDAPLPLEECSRYGALLSERPVDLCCLGIGENGHLAFNGPPVASFEEQALIKLVKLDDACKMQQVREGHFASLESVPPYAYTLTIPALCAARRMICLCPESRKSQAVRAALREPVSTACPASILRRQRHAVLLLDQDSAALLD